MFLVSLDPLMSEEIIASIKNNPNNYRISTSRYWSFDGILPANFSATARLIYDGRSASGFLDLDLVPVNADSLILLYKESPKFDWQEYPYYTKTKIPELYVLAEP